MASALPREQIYLSAMSLWQANILWGVLAQKWERRALKKLKIVSHVVVAGKRGGCLHKKGSREQGIKKVMQDLENVKAARALTCSTSSEKATNEMSDLTVPLKLCQRA